MLHLICYANFSDCNQPDVDIETFDGDVLNYHYFIALFREVVESEVDSPREKLTRLIKYTSGDARELIKHCIQLP